MRVLDPNGDPDPFKSESSSLLRDRAYPLAASIHSHDAQRAALSAALEARRVRLRGGPSHRESSLVQHKEKSVRDGSRTSKRSH